MRVKLLSAHFWSTHVMVGLWRNGVRKVIPCQTKLCTGKPVATGVEVKTEDGAVQTMARSQVTREKQAAVWIHPRAVSHILRKI